MIISTKRKRVLAFGEEQNRKTNTIRHFAHHPIYHRCTSMDSERWKSETDWFKYGMEKKI